MPVCTSSMGRPHPPVGNPKVRGEGEVGDWEGEESTMTTCGDDEAMVARGNEKTRS
jgi:hypothetical protein